MNNLESLNRAISAFERKYEGDYEGDFAKYPGGEYVDNETWRAFECFRDGYLAALEDGK